MKVVFERIAQAINMSDNETTNGTDLEKMLDSIMGGLHSKNYTVIALYFPVFLLALVANILVIAVVVKYHYMRNVTNYFLVNLAVADLLVTLVCMPNAAWHAYSFWWYLDEYTCIAWKYLQCISVAASVFTITAMALDRYLAITQPFGVSRCLCFNRRTAIIIITLIWISSMIIFFPIILVTNVLSLTSEQNFCGEYNWEQIEQYYPRPAFGIVCFSVMFAVPGCLMLWAYSMMGRKLCSVRPPFDNNEGSISTQQSFRLVRERKRVAWILLLLALIFAVCWLPYNWINLYNDVTDSNHTDQTLVQYMLLLGHTNSALNPIIYCVMSKNFRRSVKDLVFKSRINFQDRQNLRLRWYDSSGSSQRLYLQKLYNPPIIHNQLHNTLSRLQSSQKTTKTCAV